MPLLMEFIILLIIYLGLSVNSCAVFTFLVQLCNDNHKVIIVYTHYTIKIRISYCMMLSV